MKGYTITEQGDSFVFQAAITEEYLTKAVRGLRPRGRVAMACFFGVLVLVGVLSLFQVITLFNNFMSSMLILYGVLFWCIQAQGERKTVRQIMERCCAREPADLEREYTFGEQIVSYSPVTGNRKSFSYRELKVFRVTKDAYLFLLGGVTFISVPRSCFAEGQAERFERFIQEKITK